jgi:hypothetical protein
MYQHTSQRILPINTRKRIRIRKHRAKDRFDGLVHHLGCRSRQSRAAENAIVNTDVEAQLSEVLVAEVLLAQVIPLAFGALAACGVVSGGAGTFGGRGWVPWGSREAYHMLQRVASAQASPRHSRRSFLSMMWRVPLMVRGIVLSPIWRASAQRSLL